MPKQLRIYWEYMGTRYLSKRIDSNILSLDQSGTMMEQWIEHRPCLPIAISKNGGISHFSSIPVRQQKQTKFGQVGTFRIFLQFYLEWIYQKVQRNPSRTTGRLSLWSVFYHDIPRPQNTRHIRNCRRKEKGLAGWRWKSCAFYERQLKGSDRSILRTCSYRSPSLILFWSILMFKNIRLYKRITVLNIN